MDSIVDRIGVPRDVRQAIVCFGFGHSPLYFPRNRSDETGAQILARVLNNERIAPFFPIVVARKEANEWLGRELGRGAYIDKKKLKFGEIAQDAEFCGDPWFSLSILAAVEGVARRYAFYRAMSESMLRFAMLRKINWWRRLIDELPGDSIYLNANVPHALDDFIAFKLFERKALPAFSIYRLPIFEGLSARLMIFLDPFRQDHPFPIRESEGEGSAQTEVPADLRGMLEHVKAKAKESNVAVVETGLRPKAWRIWRTVRYGPRRLQMPATRRLDRNAISNIATIAQYNRLSKKLLPQSPFIYFPLHMQPEASSNPLGGMYADQRLVVEAFSHALPQGVNLLVKEHPLQFADRDGLAFRSAGFYSDIAKFDNVVLAHHSIRAESLIRRSLAAVTLTGATALEALALGRYCFVLGASMFSRAPNALRPGDHDDLRAQLLRLEQGAFPPISQARIDEFLKWIDEHSVFGYMDPYKHPRLKPKFSKEENVRAVSSALIQVMKSVLEAESVQFKSDSS